MTEQGYPPAGIDVTKMSHARAYDYVLGGKDNYPVDRAAAQAVIDLAPDLPALARAQRRFLLRVAKMCAEAGIEQFIDVGTGIPTSPNVHEAVFAINPNARVAYVDNDPIVFVHNNALLARDDRVISIKADVREPQQIMNHAELQELIDFDRPLLLLFIGLFHLVTHAEDPASLIAQFRDRMTPGSYVCMSQFCTNGSDPTARAKLEDISESSPAPMTFRTRDEIQQFFGGFEILPPGVVDIQDWWSDEIAPPTRLKCAAGVGKKA